MPQPGSTVSQPVASAQATRSAEHRMASIAFWKAAGRAGENQESIELKLGKTIPTWLRENPGKGYEEILELVLGKEDSK